MNKIVGKRFLGYVIDGLFILMLYEIGVFLFELDYFSWDFLVIDSFTFGLYLVGFFYYMVMEYLYSQTLGKMLLGTEVKFSGKYPRFQAVFIRTVSRIIPFESISIFFRSDNQMWHDMFSETKVVIKEKDSSELIQDNR